MQETGPTVYSPYPRRPERLTICRFNYKGIAFLWVSNWDWLTKELLNRTPLPLHLILLLLINQYIGHGHDGWYPPPGLEENAQRPCNISITHPTLKNAVVTCGRPPDEPAKCGKKGRTLSLQHPRRSLRIHQFSPERDRRTQQHVEAVGEVQVNYGTNTK